MAETHTRRAKGWCGGSRKSRNQERHKWAGCKLSFEEQSEIPGEPRRKGVAGRNHHHQGHEGTRAWAGPRELAAGSQRRRLTRTGAGSRSSRRSLGASKADCAHKSSPDEDGGGVLPPLCWTPILYVKSDLQSTEICGGAPARTPGLLHGARDAPGAAGRRGRIPEPLKFKSA